MRRLYRRCDAIVVPAESTAAVLRAQRMNRDISIWTRGIDREQFSPERRDMAWRRSNNCSRRRLSGMPRPSRGCPSRPKTYIRALIGRCAALRPPSTPPMKTFTSPAAM
jgi:hypothetical protein